MRFDGEIRDVLALDVREVWAERVVCIINSNENLTLNANMMN